MRILFITSSRIGEAVISCGILEHLRKLHPTARFTVACGPAAAGIFSNLPSLERLILINNSGGDFQWLRLWTKLVSNFWDIAVDVRGSGIIRFIAAGQRKIIGNVIPGRRYQQLAAAMDFSPAPLPVIWTSAADREKAERLLPSGAPIIGLGPSANSARKIWRADRFIQAGHELAQSLPGARFALFAGNRETERYAVAAVMEGLPEAINLTGKLSLSQTAACMARLRLFIGNESGLVHIAAATGVPTLGLFGREHADELAPAGLRAGVAVAPRLHGKMPMEGLTVDTVVAAATKLLEA